MDRFILGLYKGKRTARISPSTHCVFSFRHRCGLITLDVSATTPTNFAAADMDSTKAWIH